MMAARGLTLIEVLVALVLFAVLATAATQTLVAAQQARASSARWQRATGLAEERLERLRGGDRSEDGAPIGQFTRTWRSAAVTGAPRLERIDVHVDWDDRGPQRLTLTALLRRSR